MVLRCVLLKYCLFEKSRDLNIKIKGKMKFGEDPINIFYSNHYNLKNSIENIVFIYFPHKLYNDN